MYIDIVFYFYIEIYLLNCKLYILVLLLRPHRKRIFQPPLISSILFRSCTVIIDERRPINSMDGVTLFRVWKNRTWIVVHRMESIRNVVVLDDLWIREICQSLSSLSCSKIDAASNEDEINEPQFIKVAWRKLKPGLPITKYGVISSW